MNCQYVGLLYPKSFPGGLLEPGLLFQQPDYEALQAAFTIRVGHVYKLTLIPAGYSMQRRIQPKRPLEIKDHFDKLVGAHLGDIYVNHLPEPFYLHYMESPTATPQPHVDLLEIRLPDALVRVAPPACAS
ncbi:hypothetical protein HMPREF1531_00805 [Propionibacterium sp. oral taxon 192 str. F0372]|nr:hypothetical protein HMPREF1531_00805 [Propionibacterium sp. oral taxon 192 str. F0372]